MVFVTARCHPTSVLNLLEYQPQALAQQHFPGRTLWASNVSAVVGENIGQVARDANSMGVWTRSNAPCILELIHILQLCELQASLLYSGSKFP